MKTFEDFYFDLPADEKAIVGQLRQLVLDTAPNLMEKISYGVPYYFLHSRVCFIWPSSVKSGPKAGVVLGFCRGYLLSNVQGLLRMESRKEVATITMHHINDMEPALLREVLYEAILVDQESAMQKLLES